MIYVFVFIPFLLFLYTSYKFNVKKTNDDKLYIVLLSTLEATISFLVVTMFLQQGYLPRFLYWSIAFLALLIGILVFFYSHKASDDQWDIQLETLKNNFLVFLKTLLPLYFFMIIFRFWNPILQVLAAVLLTILLNLGAIFIRGLLEEKVKVFFRKLGMSSIVSSLWLWVVIVFIVAFNIFFHLPTDNIKAAFNLNDNAAYLTYDEMPVDIQNNYKQETLFSIRLEDNLEGTILDYYYDDDYLYLYSIRSELLVIDIETDEIVHKTIIGGSLTIDEAFDIEYNEYYDYFVLSDGKLLLFDSHGIYEVYESGVTQIMTASNIHSKHFTKDGALYLLERTSVDDYLIYQYTGGTFVVEETIDASLEEYDNLLVVTDVLFQQENDTLYLYSNNAVHFPLKTNYNYVYDSQNEIMYYSFFINSETNPSAMLQTETVYEKINTDGDTETISIRGQHSIEMFVNNNELFVSGFKTLEIIGDDFNYNTIFKHIDVFAFLNTNQYTSIQYNQFNVTDEGNVEFIQEQRNQYRNLIQINQLVEKDIALKLPFYTHYGILTIVPIIIGCMFELTDYGKSVKEISFKSQLKKK